MIIIKDLTLCDGMFNEIKDSKSWCDIWPNKAARERMLGAHRYYGFVTVEGNAVIFLGEDTAYILESHEYSLTPIKN